MTLVEQPVLKRVMARHLLARSSVLLAVDVQMDLSDMTVLVLQEKLAELDNVSELLLTLLD